jgi:hypothetical protein
MYDRLPEQTPEKIHKSRYKVDSDDGFDDTLFDCTQISSESESESMKPDKRFIIAAKASFQEIR